MFVIIIYHYFVGQTIYTMAEKETLDVRVIVMDKLAKMERSLRWLHKKTDIPYSTLYSIFVQKIYTPSDENLTKINKVLEDYAITA